MGHPERSNFRTGGQDAWWYFVLPDGSRRVCQVSGNYFLKTVQYLLRQNVPANTPTYAGTVSGASVTIDARVGETTLKALYALLTRMNAPEDLRAAVVASSRAQTYPLSNDTTRALIWVLAHAGANQQRGDIVLPPDAVTPQWSTAPADGTTQVTCSLIAAPAGANTTPPAPNEPDPPPPAPGDTWVPPKKGDTWAEDLPSGGGSKPIGKVVSELNTVGTPGTKDPITLALEQPVSNLPSTPPDAGMSTTVKIVIAGLVVTVVVLGVLAATKGPAVVRARRARARKNPTHVDDWLGEAFAA